MPSAKPTAATKTAPAKPATKASDTAVVQVTPLETAPPLASVAKADTQASSPPAQATRGPMIALILPIGTKALGMPAEAIKEGFNAAVTARPETDLPIRVYPTNEQTDDLLFNYKQALDEGASVVVGPLTKPAITTLANSGLVSVPTLVLNTPDAGTVLPGQMFAFGLSAEAEARQVARGAYGGTQTRALVISIDTPLNRRIALAFSEEWRQLGGNIEADFQLGSQATFSRLRDTIERIRPELVFLALDPRRARQARPYIGYGMPAYATSQVHNGMMNAPVNRDLLGVQFVDMPWLTDKGNELVGLYPVSTQKLTADLDRLYAMGIDAYRIAAKMAKGEVPASFEGVTGHIELKRQQFLRTATMTSFGSDSVQ
ncbi:penicillin-binding protein activator [Chitinivorax sp. B]|uniref:penicillin-binding protein activator n=1 Tax=Chitinivorax sp. B TaxID=2502235 RepID=UPI0014852602|nr:penicillin-binding protein activator [Chitinivorax sp. B]